jgi:alpha-beta hydrolase superfamily lysophospholipase
VSAPRPASPRSGLRRALVFACLLLAGCARTEPFRDATGHVLPGSIAAMEDVTLGNIPQRVWRRGRSVRAPPLVLLNGGPGANTSALFRRYDAALEDDFLVVYGDQRGSGRSHLAARDSAQPLTLERLLRDLEAARPQDAEALAALQRNGPHPTTSRPRSRWTSVTAPCKRLVWFEASAHNPP